MAAIAAKQPKKELNIFESFYDFYARNGHDKVFYPSSMHQTGQLEAIRLIEGRKPGRPSDEELDYVRELRLFIEKTWKGTEYDLEDVQIKPIKIDFDTEWVKAGKKIPHEYIKK